ncbi:MAG: Fe-S cluster assembly ATPase SufC [Candidatus Roizmanbacteria bacterium]
MLHIKHLSVNVAEKQILNNINFEFNSGEIYAIMGPNGSGKSTLAYSIMGHSGYVINKDSSIQLNGEELVEMEAHERSEKGIFLSFQSPLSLAGVKVNQLLQIALHGKKDALTIYKEVQTYSKELKIKEELLSRSLNEGASGGEKKKLEVLQSAILDKEVLIFDEVDTGVDIDALKTISEFIVKHKQNKIIILITHYNRILRYLRPNKVLVIAKGELKKVGDYTLAEEIEKNGYDGLINN